MLFALNSLKRRHGFDVDDVTLYLSTKGRKVDVSVVKQALSVMKTNGIFEEFYSTDLNKSVYRLR
jgi:ribosomal protein L28